MAASSHFKASARVNIAGCDPDPALHSESLTSDHGNGSQRWVAGRDFKIGNQQVALCDQGASARRDLLLFDLNEGVRSAPEVG